MAGSVGASSSSKRKQQKKTALESVLSPEYSIKQPRIRGPADGK